jgi:menaquinone-dependent protoporphyrinogen oxidase
MAADVLIAYASKRGSTEQVARAIGEALRSQRLTTKIEAAANCRDLDGFRAVVLGGSLYVGRWHRDARRFLRRHREALGSLPLAVFALGPGKATTEDFASSRLQLDAALEKATGIEPRAVAVFGGVIDPDRLRFPFNRMPRTDVRDWEEIRSWGLALPAQLELEVEAARGESELRQTG